MAQRSSRLAALSGVVFVVALVPSFLLTSGSPNSKASADKVQRYFLAHHTRYSVSALLTVLAILFGLFFYGYVRAQFRKQPGMDWLSAVFFGGAIIFAASGAIGAGVEAVIGDHPSSLTAASLQLVNQLQYDLSYPATGAGLAVLYFAAGFIIYRSKVLPVWLAWISWILGLVSASFVLAFFGLLGMALWALVVSIIFAVRNPSLDDDQPATTQVAS